MASSVRVADTSNTLMCIGVCVSVCALVSFAINANGAIGAGEGVVRGVDLESVARGIELAIELFALIIC